ncbi:lysosomal acid glucosylceramidase [Caerostris extrusa]|uniref:Glucosylceramidase n=1 Tax=Caerostris extrusa TaxID=172846 RepID=A0AAV4QPA7_CAEEX|nr:lysosomal acid glucosylceramidase [Caerostris extrusa]
MTPKMFILHILAGFLIFNGFQCSPCNVRKYGDNNIVCVCNETYCDELNLLSDVASNQAALYETNQNGARFQSSILNFSKGIDRDITVVAINRSEMYQFILGFGGAFTDATGININSVTPKLQKKIISSYFSKTGLEYTMGRVPIAKDFTLKIPIIKAAMAESVKSLLLFGTPWSPPAWMKTNNAMNGKGFLREYQTNNITFWGMTVQNEPTDGCVVDFPFQSLCFPPDMQRDFLKMDLGPALKKAGFTPDKLKVMINDDNRVTLPKWAQVILSDTEAAQYVSGIAFHWYLEDYFPHKLLDITHALYPNLFYLPSETCTGSYPWDFPKVALGHWDRGERYAHDIIQDLLNWSIGYIDWNLVLDMQGGPNWVSNFVDAPIIVNLGTNEFYKQPMYYALAQFSKCLPRGSYRIGLNASSALSADIGSNFNMAAFQTPEDKIVVIAVNRLNVPLHFALNDPQKGYLKVTVNARSIQSYVW